MYLRITLHQGGALQQIAAGRTKFQGHVETSCHNSITGNVIVLQSTLLPNKRVREKDLDPLGINMRLNGKRLYK